MLLTLVVSEAKMFRTVRDVFEKVVRVPGGLLRCLHMWRFSAAGNRIPNHLSLLAWLLLFIPTLFICVLIIGETFFTLYRWTPSKKTESPILRIFAVVPHALTSVRGCITMVGLLRKYSTTDKFSDEVNQLVKRCIPIERLGYFLRKWFVIATVSFLFGAVIYSTSYSLNWVHGLAYGNVSLTTLSDMFPFSDVPIWSYILIQAVFICIPYILSLAVAVMMLVSGVIVLDCLRAVHENLEVVAEQTKAPKFPRSSRDPTKVTVGVEEALKQRAEIYHFVKTWNHYFGHYLLLFYIVDFSVAAGMLAVVVTDSEPSRFEMLGKGFGTIVFVIFATVYSLPLMLVTEKGLETGDLLYSMSVNLCQLRAKDRQLRHLLNDFRAMVTGYPLHFSAAEFFHFGRHTIITTCTLLASFAIVLVEFIHRTEPHPELEAIGQPDHPPNHSSVIEPSNDTLRSRDVRVELPYRAEANPPARARYQCEALQDARRYSEATHKNRPCMKRPKRTRKAKRKRMTVEPENTMDHQHRDYAIQSRRRLFLFRGLFAADLKKYHQENGQDVKTQRTIITP